MFLIGLFHTFFIYCFIGWILESVFHTVWERKLVNRGFLNGPYVPIYGCGAILILHALEPFASHWYLVLPISIILTTALEYLTGWAMEKLFQNRWWDYSTMPFNLHGRICLLFSLGWGVLCLILVYVISPLVNQLILIPSRQISIISAAVIFIIMLTDLVFTIRAAFNLNETLRKLETIGQLARERRNEFAGSIQLRMSVVTKAFILWRSQVRGLGYIQRRLLRAFPSMKSLKYEESFERLRSWITKRRRKFVLPVVKIPNLRSILESIELPPRPVFRNPFANGRLAGRLNNGIHRHDKGNTEKRNSDDTKKRPGE